MLITLIGWNSAGKVNKFFVIHSIMQCHYKLANKFFKKFRLLLKVKVYVNHGKLKLAPRKFRIMKMISKGNADNKKIPSHISDSHLNKFPCVKDHITYSKATFLFQCFIMILQQPYTIVYNLHFVSYGFSCKWWPTQFW